MSQYSFKDKLDIAESIITIITFVTAIWGSIQVYESGFYHKAMHMVNYYHTQITQIEQKDLNLENKKFIKELKADLKKKSGKKQTEKIIIFQ